MEPGEPATPAQVTPAPQATKSPDEVVDPMPSPTATARPTVSPTMTAGDSGSEPVVDSTTEDVDSPLWATYRDPDSGFGYAFPCHWINRDTTLASYDQLFFMNRAVRGSWADGDPPAGAVKLEIAAFDFVESGIEPGTPREDADGRRRKTPRVEPRPRWPCERRLRARRGDRLRLRVSYVEGRRHLPVIELDRAA